MKNTNRLLRPHRAWCHVVYSGNDLDALAVDAAQIPGVVVAPSIVKLPNTVWMLPQAEALFDAVGERPTLDMYQDDGLSPEYAQPLLAHQAQAVGRMLHQAGFLLADDMGLGKSRSALAAADHVQIVQGTPGVIVGPLFTREHWRNELLALGMIRNTSEFYAFEGRDFKEPWNKSALWYFIHYDVVLSWWHEIYKLKPCVAILDEAHWAKNGRTKRAQGALMVAGTTARRFLLTGTPIDNRPADLWNLLTMTTGQGTWGHPLEYRKRYCGASYTGYGHIDGDATHVEELKMRMAPFFLRRTVAEAGHAMPTFTRSTQLCNMNRAEQREHKSVMSQVHREQLVRSLMRGSLSEDVLATLTRLRQITSASKVASTVEYVSNILDQGENCVVFCHERATVQAIRTQLGGTIQSTMTVTGELAQTSRALVVEAFQNAAEPTALIATYGSLREGVTLHRARFVVLHDLYWVLTHLIQAERRIYRIGQQHPCQATWMVAKDSIDTVLAPILMQKAEALKDILGVQENLEALNLEETVGVERFEEQVSQMLKLWGAM